MNDLKLSYKIAELVKNQGGKAYFVGGYVRDKLLNIDNKDIDIEIHGIDQNALLLLLKNFGEVVEYGKSFGIFSIKGSNIEIALPRTEIKTGNKHNEFDIKVNPNLNLYEAAKRRDFTINSLMQDILTEEIIDFFNGISDINNKVLKHTNTKTFCEDPLRVLRGAQFASRFNFSIAEETIALCQNISLIDLPKERIEDELKKALLKGIKPSLFFDYLDKMKALDYWFKEIKSLQKIPQDKDYHPEGNVYIHTMMVLDEAVKYRNLVNKPLEFMYLCLCHDFGKTITTEIIDGHIHSYNHETKGLPLIKSFITRISNNKDLLDYVLNLTSLHMFPNVYVKDNVKIKTTNKMFDKALYKEDLIYFALCDYVHDDNRKYFLLDRLNIYNNQMKEPYIKASDLLNFGLKPCKEYSRLLNRCHNLQLSMASRNQVVTEIKNEVNKIINKCDNKNNGSN